MHDNTCRHWDSPFSPVPSPSTVLANAPNYDARWSSFVLSSCSFLAGVCFLQHIDEMKYMIAAATLMMLDQTTMPCDSRVLLYIRQDFPPSHSWLQIAHARSNTRPTITGPGIMPTKSDMNMNIILHLSCTTCFSDRMQITTRITCKMFNCSFDSYLFTEILALLHMICNITFIHSFVFFMHSNSECTCNVASCQSDTRDRCNGDKKRK